jgi:hypothetical protein
LLGIARHLNVTLFGNGEEPDLKAVTRSVQAKPQNRWFAVLPCSECSSS